MKTTEVVSKDQITEPVEHTTPPAVANGSLASIQFLELIAQQPFFQKLSVHHLELLADSAMVTEFKPGQWMFRQGDPANRFYLILEGKVSIESEMRERGRIPIRTLGPGDDLGWAWLFPPYYMHFSACAHPQYAAKVEKKSGKCISPTLDFDGEILADASVEDVARVLEESGIVI